MWVPSWSCRDTKGGFVLRVISGLIRNQKTSIVMCNAMEKSIADVVYKISNFNVQRGIGYNAVLSIMDVLIPGILYIRWYCY